MRTRLVGRAAIIAVTLAATLLPAATPTEARPWGSEGSTTSPERIAQVAGQPWQEKLEARLRLLGEQARAGRRPSQSAAAERGVRAIDGRLRVVAEAAGGNRGGAATAVRAAGGIIEAEHADLVQALVPAERLPDLAADPRVRYVRTPFEPVARATAGQGVGASGATAWHQAGSTGTGARVAAFDGGFTGLQDRKNQGDIPASATVQDFCSGQINSTEHGTGVAEIVHEMAPSAQLLLYCVGSDVQLGQAMEHARAAGAHIITMSLAFLNTSRGDGNGGAGTPEATVAAARQAGILWVNSAGNASAGEVWHGAFVDANADNFHEFAPNVQLNTLPVRPGQRVCPTLSWDAWPTTNQDFALEIRDPANFAAVLAEQNNTQNGTQRPTEEVCYTNGGTESRTIGLAIRRHAATGPLPPRFLLQAFNQQLQFRNADGTIDIPATSPHAVAVAAVCWQNDRLESYSSQGPTIDGRVKPDVAAQSVVSSGAYGAWQACPADADGQGGFNGTSAAAPHFAGAAALVKGANPAFTPAQIQTFLEGRSREAGPAGRDNLFGAGILTMGAPGGTPPPPPPPPPPPTGGPAVTTNVTRAGANRLLVTMQAQTGQTISRVDWGTPGGLLPPNAAAELTDGTPISPTGLVLPIPSQTVTFHLRRTGGTTVTLPVIVGGSFGQWRTLVGGGANAW